MLNSRGLEEIKWRKAVVDWFFDGLCILLFTSISYDPLINIDRGGLYPNRKPSQNINCKFFMRLKKFGSNLGTHKLGQAKLETGLCSHGANLAGFQNSLLLRIGPTCSKLTRIWFFSLVYISWSNLLFQCICYFNYAAISCWWCSVYLVC
jgi:hypothetical protein